VRKKTIMVFLLGFMLLAISSLLPSPQPHQINRTSVIAVPSQIEQPITIIGNIELSQRSSGGVGTRSDPYLISGLTIISAGISIDIQNTTAFFAIRNCNLESRLVAEPVILLSNVENGLIQNCSLTGGSSGAYLLLSADCTIKESGFIDNSNGIQIDGSENCTILDCKAYKNNFGIRIGNSNGSIVTNNSVYGNSNRGVSVESFSMDTTIYQNKIGWNGLNAYNNGNNTEFTNGIDTGNAWSDYDGSGLYDIIGSIPSTDSFPTVLDDTVRPVIDSPVDRVFDIDSNGETLTWVASDDFAYSYTLYIDDINQDTVSWDGREITISLDALSAGTHTLVLNVQDAAGNVASDEVIATAVSFMLGGIGTEMVMWSSALTVAILILVVVIIKKMP